MKANLSQIVLKDMLGNVTDPKMRQVYGSIISGDVVAQVRCMSERCKGRVIAFIDSMGRVDETQPVIHKLKKKEAPEDAPVYDSGLEGSRQRLDGVMGFRCYCGNNSVLCEEEKGIITPARPSQEDILEIAQRLGKRKPNMYLPNKGKTNIDGFVIEEVKV